MMNNLLWYQSPKRNGEGILYVGGVLIKHGDGKRSELFDKLRILAKRVSKHSSPWCGYVGKTFFMKGFFTQKDDLGRYTPFMFATEDDNKETLNKAMTVAGMKMENRSIEVLNATKRPIKGILIGAMVAAILIIITLIAYGTRN